MHILLSSGLIQSVLSYLKSAELTAVAKAFPKCKDIVRELHHDDERREAVVMDRLRECREILFTYRHDISEESELPLGTWVYINLGYDEQW